MALIGLDIGTTGCKSTIFDSSGSICSFAYKEYEVLNTGPGMFELNPNTVWDAVKCVLAKSAERYAGEKIEALSISSFGESTIPVDKEGRVLHDSILYTDPRGNTQCKRLIKKLGLQYIMELTGVHAHPMYTINKILWYKENLPETYKKVWKFMLFEDFILFRLGNQPAIDYSLASRTMAFNIMEKKWANDILQLVDIDERLFSNVVPSGTIVETINKDVALEIGLPADLKLVTGGHDQVCAAIGAGVVKEGNAVNGMGTVECITPVFNRPVINKYMLDHHYACVPYAKEDMYVTYAFNFTGGSLLKWYRDNFGSLEIIEAKKSGESVYSILDSKASLEPTNIFVLPHFAGAGTPYMDVNAKGAIIGLTLEQTSGELYRALLEGIAYEMMYNIECLNEAGILIKELTAVGGGARSDLWLQLKADMFGRKMVALSVEEAGTVGAAILAGVAIGKYKSIDEAVSRFVKIKKEFYPNMKNNEIYQENYKKYKKIYSKIKGIFNTKK